MPIAQPGHCAHIWLNLEKEDFRWELGNDCGGLGNGTRHDGIELRYAELTNHVWSVFIIENATKDFEAFVRSEILLQKALQETGNNTLDNFKVNKSKMYKKDVRELQNDIKTLVKLFQI